MELKKNYITPDIKTQPSENIELFCTSITGGGTGGPGSAEGKERDDEDEELMELMSLAEQEKKTLW